MNHHISLRAAAALAAVAAPVLLGCLAPATAAPRASVLVPASPNYAGWLAGKFDRQATKSAASTFIVPTVICTTADANTFVVPGVGLPTGTTSVIALGVAVGCTGTTPSYAAEVDINGTVTSLGLTVNPGDKVRTSLTVTSAQTKGLFTDVTQGTHVHISGKGGNPTGVCIGIDGSENGTNDPPVPNFGKVVFSVGTLNGKTIAASGATRVNMATTGGVLQISTGNLNARGNGFTSKFVNNG